MRGIIDVGGGTRDIFGAGVFDYFLEYGEAFDRCYGVSAGCANIASFLAGQQHRNYEFYTEYAMRKEYMSLDNFIKTGSYVDLDYVYGTLSNSYGEYPLNFEVLKNNPSEFIIIAAEANTGKTKYFTKADLNYNNYAPINASSCVPVVNKPYKIDGVEYFDGGIADPIPYKKALDDGCDELVIILTRPKDSYRVGNSDKRMAQVLARQYPKAAELLEHRAEIYNIQLDAVKKLEEEGVATIIAPKSIGKLKTLTRDIDKLKSLYRKGLVAAKNANIK
ncbi:patatin-like phospholipase family protein [Mogibacterium pumilum]|uniref:Patatin family protein n=1 Tax=Mogibacterium pumilum TaxID=86332 RepID=A0A223ATC5_9FIRM|nr:patatin family protein [Mogibacterium pumilum]ASS38224.1 patatin family protein [Mogibacterium pumilum]